jgi:predicted metal-dependent HD superfamily phosphohydrolase
MKFQQLLEETKRYVVSYFEMRQDPDLIYHDIKHTKDVVTTATRIANHYQLNDEDFFIVVTAAWFHDTGYFLNKTDHENQSATNAAEFLKQLKVDDAVIEKVKGCILATRMPQNPEGLLQQILCDADLYHLGTDDFADRSKLMRKEMESCKHVEIDKQLWREKTIELMEAHHYFTDYAQLLLNDQKEKNLRKLKNKQEKALTEAAEPITEEKPEKDKGEKHDHEKHDHDKDDHEKEKPSHENKPGEVILDKKKKERPEKGIETMFRITSGNNQRLSDMADNKAHILITVNSIILSAIISLVLRKLDENSFLTIPSFLLLTVSLLSMIFSILATRPSIPSGVFTQQDMDLKRVNLLFFGNFYKMSMEDYTSGMIEVMNDIDFLYGTLIRDVYSQGVVLGRKYRLLRVAYNIFMFGLIIAVIAFIIASIINNRNNAVIRPH